MVSFNNSSVLSLVFFIGVHVPAAQRPQRVGPRCLLQEHRTARSAVAA